MLQLWWRTDCFFVVVEVIAHFSLPEVGAELSSDREYRNGAKPHSFGRSRFITISCSHPVIINTIFNNPNSSVTMVSLDLKLQEPSY